MDLGEKPFNILEVNYPYILDKNSQLILLTECQSHLARCLDLDRTSSGLNVQPQNQLSQQVN